MTSRTPARYLIASTPAGIDAFFADAGEAISEPVVPSEPAPSDRDRLRAAFAKYHLELYTFPADSAVSTTGVGPTQVRADSPTRA